MILGTVLYELADAPRDRLRRRLDSVVEVPTGARVVVRVGALAPEPEAVRLLALHERRLQLDIQGTPRAVRLWMDAVRDNLGEVLVP